jgi:hypothetical protein
VRLLVCERLQAPVLLLAIKLIPDCCISRRVACKWLSLRSISLPVQAASQRNQSHSFEQQLHASAALRCLGIDKERLFAPFEAIHAAIQPDRASCSRFLAVPPIIARQQRKAVPWQLASPPVSSAPSATLTVAEKL